MSFQEIMLDLETLSTKPNAVIVSIGAVAFNMQDKDTYDDFQEDRVFECVLDLETQINMGRDIEMGTLSWWMLQDAAARQVFQAPSKWPREAIEDFSRFCKKAGAKRLWGNGSVFDNIILRSIYNDFGIEFPTPFWGDSDLRTLKFCSGEDKLLRIRGVEHDAVDDAKYQVLCAQHYWRTLHGSQTGNETDNSSS